MEHSRYDGRSEYIRAGMLFKFDQQVDYKTMIRHYY